MPISDRTAHAALVCLVILHGVMLAALFAGVEPHPPSKVAPFGMAPFLGAVFCAAVSAMMLGSTTTQAGRVLTGLTIVLSLVSFGPHKIFDPAFPLIWPAVLTAWVSMAALAVRVVAETRGAGSGR